MAEMFDSMTQEHVDFIHRQPIFFAGTAGVDGRVNVSPKGMDTLRVADSNQVVWLNLTGSGNETAAHLAEVNRMTIMFCSFERQPLILRLYGSATVVHPRDANWATLVEPFGDIAGARQVFVMDVDLVQTSCGFAVPLMDHVRERDTLRKWAEGAGEQALSDYWREKNQLSLDGKPTHILG